MTDPADPVNRPQVRLIKPVVLIGLMGAGKSSVGVKLAQRLSVPFADSDDEIVAAANMSIADIFEQYGEPEFRTLERRVIGRLVSEAPRVIATGGGAFMDAETRRVIAQGAISVWLNAKLDVLVARTAGRTHRPILNRGDPREILSDLIATRYPIYAAADVSVESRSGQVHNEMASRIIAALVRDGRAVAQDQAGQGQDDADA